jgi:hypothetical protein
MILIREKFFSEHKIGGMFRFPPSVTDKEIIDHILSDFALKLYGIMKLYQDPKIGCSSLCTYDVFRKFWEIDDPGDVSHDGEEIYSEIPSELIAKKIEEMSGGKITKEEVDYSFGGGEFPLVKIWKGYKLDPKSNGEGRNEIHATYDIMR